MGSTLAYTALDKPAKKKQAAVGVDDTGVRVALSAGFLFSTGKIELTTAGRAALCDIAKAGGGSSLHVSGVANDDDVPAALKAKYSNAWEYAAAIAASVADTLETKCSVARTRLSIESPPAAAAQAFGGQAPSAPRVEITLGAKK